MFSRIQTPAETHLTNEDSHIFTVMKELDNEPE